ncbi:hypothetical protein ACIBI9_11235 [Nonomuraea sp. NPDC050451]|uniref:hypothetical protein n=1 Tax=Nonomuraea sp. NPDC050451 TaxID=3364364 RepID=UPI0037B32DC6
MSSMVATAEPCAGSTTSSERAGGHPEPARLQGPDGAVYAEFSGDLGCMLNACPPSTRYEIDYPPLARHAPARPAAAGARTCT